MDEKLEQLGKPLPKEAIQKTTKEQTKKGYDTTGLGYQFCVNRFNEVYGENWGYEYKILKETTGKFKSGAPYYDLTVELIIWVNKKGNERKCVGGHISSVYADAFKGAITNAFKKTAAFWGVGRQAYEGSLDDDAKYEDEVGEAEPEKKAPEKTKGVPGVPLLTFEELKDKMDTSKNVFELNNRCKKYVESYNALTPEQQVSVRTRKDARKTWLVRGEGDYKDEETRGVNKPKEEEKGV